MERDILRFFQREGKKRDLPPGCCTRIAKELRRNGIGDMDSLQTLMEHNPEKVRSLRNIGDKSMDVIGDIIKSYVSPKAPSAGQLSECKIKGEPKAMGDTM